MQYKLYYCVLWLQVDIILVVMVMVVYSGILWHCCNCLCDVVKEHLKVKNHVLVDTFDILPHKKEQQWSGLVTLEDMPGYSNCSVSVFSKKLMDKVTKMQQCTNCNHASSDNCGLHMNDLSQSLREKEMFKSAFPHYAAPYIHFWCVPLMFNDGHIMQNCAVMPLQQTITKGCLIKTEY